MSGINIPPAMPPGIDLNTLLAHFEEEKSLHMSMWACKYVVITPFTRRKLMRKKSRHEQERDDSCLGKVIRRYRIAGADMKKAPSGYAQDDGDMD